MGSQNYLQAQPYRQSTLRSVYSVGDVEGVLGPPAFSQSPSSYSTSLNEPQSLYGFPSSSGSINDSAPARQQFPSSGSVKRQSVLRASQRNNPKRKAIALTSDQITAPLSLLTAFPTKTIDNPYASLVPRSVRRKSSETTNNTVTTNTSGEQASDPPPSYSPPRKTSSEDSVSRGNSRRNSARRPRSRRDSRPNPADTDSDQAGRSKKSVTTSDDSPCGCSVDMSQWGVQNGNHIHSESSGWSQNHPSSQVHPQIHASHPQQGLPRTLPPTNVPFQRISHTKYPSSPTDVDAGPEHKPSSGCRGVGRAPPSCCGHHCCQQPCACQASARNTCCSHHHNSCAQASACQNHAPLSQNKNNKHHQSSEEFSKIDKPQGSGCQDCMSRVPYATLIATVMCCVGVGVFCGTMYRGTTLTMRMLQEVFRLQIEWVQPVQLTFLVVGASMGGLALMILFVGCLSTGATRARVYASWRGRVGGRISCALFMTLAYILVIVWLAVFAGLLLVTMLYSIAWLQCSVIPDNQCIDYNQLGFLFPGSTPEEDKRICQGERKLFCKDFVNNAEVMFIIATSATIVVILSLIHYLMCLAANYAHIKDQEKFMDLQDLQYLRDSSEMSTLPKDRF
ncbi:uncharacterized protein LOC108664473 isoform X2 [Hyalella azteca]|uniref:Uncharacterized protein LOC108664473 isoform X2 n=1 Tax=Hyalella azteca TaxID=294128 RepID=A0A8B7MZ62_HYAAZ|nr:uncharacterized protein LOC108664473 isoform X2 [Hyalella azteca]